MSYRSHNKLCRDAKFRIATFCLCMIGFYSGRAIAQTPPPQKSSCPTDVENLTSLLIRDLPSYANRVSQRSRRLNRKPNLSSSVIIAGRPEFAPLTLGPGPYTSDPGADITTTAPKQVFITTLERGYTARKPIQLQQYHWLFLTQTEDGWRLATMFSRTGPYPEGDPPSPPRDSSNGIIGQAVRNWLQDCRVGKIN